MPLINCLSCGWRNGPSRRAAIGKASTNRSTSNGRRVFAVRSTRLRTSSTSNTRAKHKKITRSRTGSTSSNHELVNTAWNCVWTLAIAVLFKRPYYTRLFPSLPRQYYLTAYNKFCRPGVCIEITPNYRECCVNLYTSMSAVYSTREACQILFRDSKNEPGPQ